jgi:hypothetical protein
MRPLLYSQRGIRRPEMESTAYKRKRRKRWFKED